MSRAAFKISRISRQRGFWLRCFLGVVMLASLAAIAHAQPDPPQTLHLAHLRGVFVTPGGQPIAGAAVTLAHGAKVIYSTTTDRAGRFAFKHVSGHFGLHMRARNYSPVDREVIVGLEMLTYLHSNTLYVIAGPGACSDDCASIFTSKDDFNRQLKHDAGHYD